MPLLLVLHPRTRAALASVGELDALEAAGARVLGPLDYVDFLSLEAGAGAVLTDSSGVQEEATLLGVPCFTLRRTTERTLTLTHGTNVLLGDDPGEIADIALRTPRNSVALIPQWDGQAGWRIARDLLGAGVMEREG
jgi:UDP-N-acetylglucosamine 2-epimerase (non-hydrolysing)